MATSEELTTIKVPTWFKDWVKEHKRDDETMFEAWQRLSGGPHPREVAGILTEEQAETMRDAVQRQSETAADATADLRDAFDDS